MVSAITVYKLITGCEKSPARGRLFKQVNAFLAPFTPLVFTVEDAWLTGARLNKHP